MNQCVFKGLIVALCLPHLKITAFVAIKTLRQIKYGTSI